MKYRIVEYLHKQDVDSYGRFFKVEVGYLRKKWLFFGEEYYSWEVLRAGSGDGCYSYLEYLNSYEEAEEKLKHRSSPNYVEVKVYEH